MPRDDFDEDDEQDDDIDAWDEDSDDDTYPCPYCGAAVYEDAEWCPSCEKYLSDEDAPPRGKPWWIIAGALAVLTAFLWIYFSR